MIFQLESFHLLVSGATLFLILGLTRLVRDIMALFRIDCGTLFPRNLLAIMLDLDLALLLWNLIAPSLITSSAFGGRNGFTGLFLKSKHTCRPGF